MTTQEFKPFPKIARLSRECIVTEKIDGTNASITITEDGQFLTASRNRWITPESDNFGFSKWANERKDELISLGVGTHFGEWWGVGIQRGYGLTEKRFSLFNVTRWCLHFETPQRIPCGDPRIEKFQQCLPACVGLVPTILRGINLDMIGFDRLMASLYLGGSLAAPGFMNPEGIVVYHVASGALFKKTINNDSEHKGNIS